MRLRASASKVLPCPEETHVARRHPVHPPSADGSHPPPRLPPILRGRPPHLRRKPRTERPHAGVPHFQTHLCHRHFARRQQPLRRIHAQPCHEIMRRFTEDPRKRPLKM